MCFLIWIGEFCVCLVLRPILVCHIWPHMTGPKRNYTLGEFIACLVSTSNAGFLS